MFIGHLFSPGVLLSAFLCIIGYQQWYIGLLFPTVYPLSMELYIHVFCHVTGKWSLFPCPIGIELSRMTCLGQ